MIWLIFMLTFKNPPLFKTKLVSISLTNQLSANQIAQRFLHFPGVIEANVSIEDSIAYLKVDNKIFDENLFEMERGLHSF